MLKVKKRVVYQKLLQSLIIIISASMLFAGIVAADWQKETINQEYQSDSSLAYDNLGQPHIVFLNSQLIYGYKSANQWIFETIDTGVGSDSISPIQFTTNNNPYISYRKDNDYLYAVRSSGTWQITNIGYNTSNQLALRLDQNNYPHICYWYPVYSPSYGYSGTNFEYATFNGISWNNETIHSVGQMGGFRSVSMFLDELDNPHIIVGSSFDTGIASGAEVRYFSKSDGGWINELLWQTRGAGGGNANAFPRYLSLTPDRDGNPCALYLIQSGAWSQNPIFNYTYSDGSQWITESIDYSKDIFGNYRYLDNPSLFIDSENNPVIGYSYSAMDNWGDPINSTGINILLKNNGIWTNENYENRQDQTTFTAFSLSGSLSELIGICYTETPKESGSFFNYSWTTTDETPTITSLSPTSIIAGNDGFILDVTGTNFIDGAKVYWNGEERETEFVSETQLNATILQDDVANAGMYTVTVVNPNGVESGELHFEVTSSSSGELLPPPTLLGPGDPSSPGPIIDTLTPQFNWTLVPYADEYGLYIRNLNSDTIIFDSRLAGYTITGNTFPLPSGILQPDTHYRWNMNSHSSAGWNDDVDSGYSQKFYFTTPVPTTPVPTSPTPIPTLPPQYKVYVNVDRNYDVSNPNITITFAGGPGINFVTTLDCEVTQSNGNIFTGQFEDPQIGSQIVLPGSTGTDRVEVKVQLVDGYNYTIYDEMVPFQVIDLPIITTLTPSSITAGSDGFTLEVIGTNFVEGAKVLWGGQERETEFVSETKLKATILKEDVASEGTYKIKVVNPDGNVSNEYDFNVIGTAPTNFFSPGDYTAPGPILVNLTPEFSWPQVSGSDGYGLYIRDLDSNTLVFDSRSRGISITATHYSLPAGVLENGKKYRWNMNAHTDMGWGSYSTPLYFQAPVPQSLLPPPVLDSPGGVSSISSELVSLTPTFSWQAVSGADRYSLYISDITNETGSPDLIFNSDTRGITITGTSYPLDSNILHDGKKYRWNMKSHSSAGLGSANVDRLYFHTTVIEPTSLPIADFSVNPESPKTDSTAIFDASTSYSPNGETITRYIWRIDNGLKQESNFPIQYQKFQTAGSHEVELTVRNQKGILSNPVKKTIFVLGSDEPLSIRLTAPEKVSSQKNGDFLIEIINNENRNSGPIFIKMELPTDEFSLISSSRDNNNVIYYNANTISDIISWGSTKDYNFYYDEENDPDNIFWFFENIPAKESRQIKITLEKKKENKKPSAVINVVVKDNSKFQNLFYPGIGWEPENEDHGNSARDRLSKAYDLDSILVRSYFETNKDIKFWDSPSLKMLQVALDLNAAVQVYLAYNEIFTDKNYVNLSYPDGIIVDGLHYNIVFSHSGGTQTLYQKLKNKEITANYAFFVAPALLDTPNLTHLITNGTVKKIFIVQSSDDILYQTFIQYTKHYDFRIQIDLPPNIQPGIKFHSPIYTGWWGISPLIDQNSLDKLPINDQFWIGGDRPHHQLFNNITVNTGKTDDDHTIDIITITNTYLEPYNLNPLENNRVHKLLLFDLIEAYNHDQYPFDGTYPGLQKVPLPKTQIDSAVVCFGTAHDPNEKYGPEGHHPSDEPLHYKIEYENEGDGSAFEVYVTDILDPSLDDSTLEISPMYSVATGQQITERGIYFPENRTVYWDVGTVAPGEGGYANISVEFLPSVPDGTFVTNSATVFFPSAFEETQTNVIVTIKGVNLPPEVPNLTHPSNNEIKLPINGTLFWTGHDPNNESLVYDVYLGTSTLPPLVLENSTLNMYYYSELGNNAVYYWKIVAKDPYDGVTSSEIYQFTTVSNVTPPLANFTANTTLSQLPLPIQFTDNSTGEAITSRLWSFGDGGTSTELNPLHVYTTPGLFTVSLEVTNDGGSNTSTRTNYIRVFDATPIADFIAEPQSGYTPLPVQFHDTSAGSPTGWQWDFGDGTTTTLQSPYHTYTTPGNYTVTLTVGSSGGTNTTVKADFIRVMPEGPPEVPVANFTADIWTGGRFSAGADFYDASTGNPDSWNWSFGDGSYSNERNPWHYYQGIGSYPVSLTVSNSAGSDTITRDDFIVIPTPPPEADFSGSPRYGTFPLTVEFTDYSIGSVDWDTPPLTYEWDFGDGSLNSTQKGTVSHHYMAAGTYTVTLTVTDIGGSDTLALENYIGEVPPPQPIADFTATPKYGFAPLTVDFIDQSTGSPLLTYTWDLGDGNASYEKSPSHTYTQPGLYNISLITTNVGGSDTLTKAGFIEVLSAPEKPPLHADFTSNITTGTMPVTIQFLDTSTGNPSAWSWFFEKDSYYSVGESQRGRPIPVFGNELSHEKNPVVTYTYPGNYSVSLTVSRTGETDTITKDEYIRISPPAPEVDFSAYPPGGEAPLEVEFWENVPYAGYYDEFLWDFGDGTNGTGTWLYHTYENPGLYDVTLTVNSAYGSNSTTKTNFINVTRSEPPVPDFTGSPLSGNAPLDVGFTDTSMRMVTTRLWDFGDGTTAWENGTPTVPHTYFIPGTYTITLTTGNDAGSNSITKAEYVHVNPSGTPPDARFILTPRMGNAPLTVQFTDRSNGIPLKWLWDFGDGTTSSEQNPSHTYTTPGRYLPKLTVYNSGGSDSSSSFVWIRSMKAIFPTYTPSPTITENPTIPPVSGKSPISFFAINKSFGSAPMTVQFTDRSFNTPTSWQWDFGDGQTSTERNPVNIFTESGTYIIRLIVKNSIGESSTSRRILVR